MIAESRVLPGVPGRQRPAAGLEMNTWIASAPVSAAYRSPPAASPPVTRTWAPIGRLGCALARAQSLEHRQAGLPARRLPPFRATGHALPCLWPPHIGRGSRACVVSMGTMWRPGVEAGCLTDFSTSGRHGRVRYFARHRSLDCQAGSLVVRSGPGACVAGSRDEGAAVRQPARNVVTGMFWGGSGFLVVVVPRCRDGRGQACRKAAPATPFTGGAGWPGVR